jgi:hypothetical protein
VNNIDSPWNVTPANEKSPGNVRRGKNSMSKAKLPDAYLMAMVIKAWNARRNGKAMLALRYIEGGPRPESFPVVL